MKKVSHFLLYQVEEVLIMYGDFLWWTIKTGDSVYSRWVVEAVFLFPYVLFLGLFAAVVLI